MRTAIIALMMLLFVSTACALTVDINVKPVFLENEVTSFNYTLIFDQDGTITYEPYIFCPQIPLPFKETKTAQLKKGVPLQQQYAGPSVGAATEPQECTASVRIIMPSLQTESKTFEIKTQPSIAFDLSICKDSSCSQQAKVFTLGSTIYLAYFSVAAPYIAAKLTYPDSTVRQLSLPASLQAEQIGTYTLEATASASGYKTTTKTELFGVIGEEPEFAFVGICNADGVCSGREHRQNCPQDCPSGGRDGYCDKLSDSVCDPDCAAGGDYDCAVQQQQKGTVRMLILVIAILVIVITAVLLIYGRQAGGRKMLTETQDLELRNYILAALSRGQSKEQIKKQLISLGWKEQQLKSYFK